MTPKGKVKSTLCKASPYFKNAPLVLACFTMTGHAKKKKRTLKWNSMLGHMVHINATSVQKSVRYLKSCCSHIHYHTVFDPHQHCCNVHPCLQDSQRQIFFSLVLFLSPTFIKYLPPCIEDYKQILLFGEDGYLRLPHGVNLKPCSHIYVCTCAQTCKHMHVCMCECICVGACWVLSYKWEKKLSQYR